MVKVKKDTFCQICNSHIVKIGQEYTCQSCGVEQGIYNYDLDDEYERA